MMDEQYDCKGNIVFSFNQGEIEYYKEDYRPCEKEMHRHYIYDLMSGKDFYESVDYGGFIDYDGMLSDVYVDGYHSNLGLRHKGICQGKFIVDGDTWLDICDQFKVEVNWANK